MGSLQRCHYDHYVVSKAANKVSPGASRISIMGYPEVLIWGLQWFQFGVSRGDFLWSPNVSIQSLQQCKYWVSRSACVASLKVSVLIWVFQRCQYKASNGSPWEFVSVLKRCHCVFQRSQNRVSRNTKWCLQSCKYEVSRRVIQDLKIYCYRDFRGAIIWSPFQQLQGLQKCWYGAPSGAILGSLQVLV